MFIDFFCYRQSVSADDSDYLLNQDEVYPCHLCGKTFRSDLQLVKHQRSHAVEHGSSSRGAYQCPICERKFEHSGKLSRHMRIHTGERPHRCRVCNKTFIQSGQLVIHMRTHTGEKPYTCSTCEKAFTCSKQLKVHMRTHTGEKPYHCDICGKCFGYNHVLKLHQVQHFGCRVFKCTICDSTFVSKKEMEIHIVNHDDRDMPRPSSTGSTLSQISQEKDRSTPSTTSSPLPNYISFTPSSPAASPRPSVPYLLPSVNTVCPDLPNTFPMAALRRSIIARNPLYPVTMPLIKDLVAQDEKMFGHLPVLKSFPLEALMASTGLEDRPSPCPSPGPLNLTITASLVSDTSSAPTTRSPAAPSLQAPSPAPSPTYAKMTNSSLPPRKRKFVCDVEGEGPRGSVIQFARRT